jgi:aerobic carbon-monoxide dehydrogenase medium subunit
MRIGALATHARIGTLDAGVGPLGALAQAARLSAFPAVQNVATLAGNICAQPFPEADLVPALVASEATVEVAAGPQRKAVPIAEYLSSRDSRPQSELVTAVRIPMPPGRRSVYQRLTVRNGGEYPVASVALSVDVVDGVVAGARVSFGSVEAVASRCTAAERVLVGSPLEGAAGERAGREAAGTLQARDGLDAPAGTGSPFCRGCSAVRWRALQRGRDGW